MTATSRISFYVLSTTDPGSRTGFACRLIEKVWKLGQRVHAATEDARAAQALDDLLWTFRQGSFVPHELLAPGRSPEAPVTIGTREDVPPAAEVLVNLAEEVPAWFGQFERVAEIVDGSAPCREAGRARHRYYRAQGLSPETLEVE